MTNIISVDFIKKQVIKQKFAWTKEEIQDSYEEDVDRNLQDMYDYDMYLYMHFTRED